MLGRRGKADPGRHPVRAAPEAAENRFMPDGLKIWFGPYGKAELRANRA